MTFGRALMTPFETAWRRAIEQGSLAADPAQEKAAACLAELAEALAAKRRPLWRKGWRGLWRRRALKGIYLWGPPGSGKSLLVDLFMTHAPGFKQRLHFIELMRDVHQKLAAARRERGGDPVAPVAKSLAQTAPLLACDEFQVEDIADASILSRLFTSLFQSGLILAATSNQPPEELYQNGLQRQRFLPFIALLRRHCDIVALDGGRDYRLLALGDEPGFYLTGAGATARMDRIFTALTGALPVCGQMIKNGGRMIHAPLTAGSAARFDFAELCGQPLGGSDYLALAGHFRTILLNGVPVLSASYANEARRFMLLVDALYDRRVKLIIAAARPPDEIFALTPRPGLAGFARTISRLHEMSRKDWAEK